MVAALSADETALETAPAGELKVRAWNNPQTAFPINEQWHRFGFGEQPDFIQNEPGSRDHQKSGGRHLTGPWAAFPLPARSNEIPRVEVSAQLRRRLRPKC